MMFELLLVSLSFLLVTSGINTEFVISCRANVDCPYSMFCDLSMGKPPSCTPCMDCRHYNRHSSDSTDVTCVSFVLADCGPCFYGYKDTHHYDPSMRMDKCTRDYNIRNGSFSFNSSSTLLTLFLLISLVICY